MAKGFFINYFETLRLDPADGRIKNYEILKERYNESTGKLSQEAVYQAGILNRAMEAFKTQENYEDFLKDCEESQRRQQERAARERAQQERERAEREQAERQRTERQRAEREQAERQRAEPERDERQHPDQERAAREPIRSPRRRRAIVISAASALVAIGATIGGLLLFNKPSPPVTPEVFVAISPNGKFMASGHFDGDSVYIWTIATKRMTATLSFPGGVRDFSFSSDSKMLVVAPDFGHVTIWSVTANRTVATINNPRTDNPYCVALSPDDKMLAVCSSNGPNLYLLDVASESISATLHPVNSSTCGGAAGAAFSPDGKILAVAAVPCSGGNSVQLWDISTRHITATITGSYPLVYSNDGSMLVAGGTLVWQDPGINGSTWTIENGNFESPVAFSPDDKTLATSQGPEGTTSDGPIGTIFLWSLSTKHKIVAFTDPSSEAVTGIAYTPDGKTLVVADGNEHIYLWNIAARRITATLTNPNS